jgi:hypothetical protein
MLLKTYQDHSLCVWTAKCESAEVPYFLVCLSFLKIVGADLLIARLHHVFPFENGFRHWAL